MLPKFDLAIIIIEQMSILQDALARKKHKEQLRREHKQKQALQDIKEIFLDAFNLYAPAEDKSIMDQLVNIVKQVNDTNLDSNVKTT